MQKINVIVEGQLLNPIPGLPPDGGAPTDPLPPSLPVPYFDVGDATGKPGDTVSISVEGGCSGPINGFHIGGGVGLDFAPGAGYGKFRAVDVELGEYLADYFLAQGLSNYRNFFQFASWESHYALPEEWWEYSVGFYNISDGNRAPPVVIPSGTKLFTVKIEILSSTAPGVYELTCKDEYYYTHARQRRRDFMYNNERQGYTKIETLGGNLTVVA